MPRSELDRDLAVFDKMSGELESKYDGRWVVFREGEFIAAYDTFEKAAEDAVGRFGRGPFLIKQVGAPPITLPASVMFPIGHA